MNALVHTLEQREFSVVFDPANKLVRIAMRGHWDTPLATHYVTEFRKNLRVMPAGGCPLGQQRALIDIREFSVQSQDVAAILETVANDPSIAPARTAIVAASALLTLQARRVAPDYRLFGTMEEAVDWLSQG